MVPDPLASQGSGDHMSCWTLGETSWKTPDSFLVRGARGLLPGGLSRQLAVEVGWPQLGPRARVQGPVENGKQAAALLF